MCSNPTWSPDGKSISFLYFRDGSTTDVCVMKTDGSDIRNLTNDGVGKIALARSPTGEKISFLRSRGGKSTGRYDLYVMDSDGSNQKNLTDNKKVDIMESSDFVWSPDGKKIAFSDDNNIWMVDMEDGDLKNLANTNEYVAFSRPTWSPDGKKIAFLMPDRESGYYNRKIYVMNADGSNVKKISK